MPVAARAIMFHHFHGRGHPIGQGSISADELRALLARLDPQRILAAREFARRAAAGRLKDDDLCLTFDDGLLCQIDVAAPVLREHHLTAFWFVATAVLDDQPPRLEIDRAFRDRYFDHIDDFYDAFDQAVEDSPAAADARAALAGFDPQTYLAEFPFYSAADRRFRFLRDRVLGPQRYAHLMDGLMAAHGASPAVLARRLWVDCEALRRLHDEGHVVGLHSHTHPTRLADLAPAEQLREYRINQRVLAELLGSPPTCMSHPCNSYSRQTLEILRRLGVTLGFRANCAAAAASDLELPREDHANLMRELACASQCSPATSRGTSR